MDSSVRADGELLTDASSAVSWSSIAAGAVAIASVTLLLLALGAGLGLSSISPWTDTGLSAATFKVTAGVYLVLVAVMASAIGGFLAARLRTKWVGIHTNEAFFRDTAHGFIAWAFAILISATLLGAATAHLLGGAASGAGAAATQPSTSVNPTQVYVDRLFRRDTSAAVNSTAAGAVPATNATAAGTASAPETGAAASPTATTAGGGARNNRRVEVLRLWTASPLESGGLSADDKTYVVRLISERTGLSAAEAQKRLDDVVAQAKADADRARRGAAQLAFWTTAALLFGAFAASLAAAEGGQYRDGNWNERRLVPRSW
jgi:hypothetical protein